MKTLPIATPIEPQPDAHEWLIKRTERNDRIIEDYRACVGLLNEVFGLLYDEVCKPCIAGENDTPEAIARGYDTKGKGCCEGTYHDDGLGGPAANTIRTKWDVVYEEAGEQGKDLGNIACGYLETGKGCVLGDLKAPRCASQFCWEPELGEKYGVDFDEMGIQESLEFILADVIQEERLGPTRPMTREYVADFKGYLQSMVDAIKSVQSID